MRGKFWKGLIWGSIAGTIMSALFGSRLVPQRKPLIVRGKEAVKETVHELMKEAKKTRNKLLKR